MTSTSRPSVTDTLLRIHRISYHVKDWSHMPRTPDPLLEERILDAAQELWIAGGDDALSMRAVAAKAGTHTPRIYARFKDREQILRALRSRVVARLRDHLSACTS